GWQELIGSVNSETCQAKSLRKLYDIRIAEGDASPVAEAAKLVGLDDPETAIQQDHDREGRAQPLRRFEFLDIHEEPAVATHRNDLAIRPHQFGGDGSRQGDAH